MTDLVLSVKDLVEFSARSGDLFFDSGGPSHLEGLAAHRQVQGRRGGEWRKEYTLRQELNLQGLTVTLQGRADLVNESGDPVAIEEIKSTYVPAERIPPSKKALFWAQARVYAYLHALTQEQRPKGYQLCLTLVQAHSYREESEQQYESFDAIEQYVLRLLDDYLCWFRRIQERRALTAASARALTFPHSQFRPGQHALAGDIYRCLRAGKSMVAEASTGIGKTISTLFPAAKAVGEGLIQQIVYLSAKTSGQRQAEDALQSLRKSGLEVDHLTLCARDKLCPCRSGEGAALLDDQGRCRLTLGFYDRLPTARSACLEAAELDVQQLSSLAGEHQVCPFALGQHLLPWSTVVIGDYNYLFDPLAGAGGFSHGSATRAVLIDEAHNLPQRGREMFSARLASEDLARLARLTRARSSPLARIVARLQRMLLTWAQTSAPVAEQLPEGLPGSFEELIAALQALDGEPLGSDLFAVQPPQDDGIDFRMLYRFRAVLQRFGDAHRALLQVREYRGKKQFDIHLICLDAAPYLREGYAKARAVVAFSATLSPMMFFKNVLGLPEAWHLRLDSPFPAEHCLVLSASYIDTRWQQRQDSIAPLADLIAAISSKKPGKYLVFFASYDYLRQVHERVNELHPALRVQAQSAAAQPVEQAAFLNAFLQSDEPVLGFAILGGSYAEGIDYIGDALHGAIVVGTGMPQPSVEQNLMQTYFEKKRLNGFQYAYLLPGLARVQQSAGRVIRSETDRGFILLVDPRYRRPDYRSLLPTHWRPVDCVDSNAVQTALANFWQAQHASM